MVDCEWPARGFRRTLGDVVTTTTCSLDLSVDRGTDKYTVKANEVVCTCANGVRRSRVGGHDEVDSF